MVTMMFCRRVSLGQRHGSVREILLIALEQQPLGPVANLLSRGQDITWLPGLHEALPPESTRKSLSHLSALDPVGLKANSLLEGLEKRVFGSVVYLDLFVIGDMLAEPVVWHFSGDWGRLPLVAIADRP